LLALLMPLLDARSAGNQNSTSTPLGRLVSVGDHRLHIYCTGTGSPAVVLEAGMGANHLDWIRTQPSISEATQVCSYDRAGYGWSDTYKDLAFRLARKTSARSFMFDELRSLQESIEQLEGTAQLRPLRTEVITHGRREWDRLYSDGRMENLWTQLQADLARQTGARRLVVAHRSGHQIPLEDPALVDRMVRSVIADTRQQAD
jgi:pimeloyl-ACP methyl ester carboxylesterase